MATNTIFTLNDFERISKSKYNYPISLDTIEIINLLADKVGAPSYVKTPNFKHEKRNKNNKYQSEINNEDWDTIRNFQSTEFKQVKGVDKIINNIKLEINKITKTTYNNQINIIYKQLEELEQSDIITYDEKKHVGEIIFDVASCNMFYSELYADLVNKLSLKFEWLLEIFHSSLKHYTHKFMKFETNISHENYEKFCQVNKDNEARKALIKFYINLMYTKIINIKEIISILENMKLLLNDYLQDKNYTNAVEQLAENICIIIENLYNEHNDKLNDIISYFKNLSIINKKIYPGLSNKTIFRFMDTLDIIS